MAPSNKTMLFVCLLVAAVAVVVPVAQGTLLPVLPSVVISINGTLFCSANLSSNGSGTPPFPNATVQLRCGAGSGTPVATATTNSTGRFSIMLNAVQFLPTNVLSTCRLVVTTPFTSCNATNLPPTAGRLSAPLQLVGITLSGLRISINFSPGTFTLNAIV